MNTAKISLYTYIPIHLQNRVIYTNSNVQMKKSVAFFQLGMVYVDLKIKDGGR